MTVNFLVDASDDTMKAMMDSERASRLYEAPTSSGIQDLVGRELDRQASMIPPIPEILFKLDAELENEWVNVARLANLVRTDPTLSASVLRVVNSPAMRGSQEITELEEAIGRMGKEHLRTIAAFFALHGGAFPSEGLFGEHLHAFWRHALLVAAGAVQISRSECSERAVLQDIWTAGLLHDLGALLVPKVFPHSWETFSKAVDDIPSGETADLLEMSRTMLGCDHARISAGFASRYWKRSPTVSVLAGAWTDPESLEPSWAAWAIRRADEAAQALGVCWQPEPTRIQVMDVLSEELGAKAAADPEFCLAAVRRHLPLVEALLTAG